MKTGHMPNCSSLGEYNIPNDIKYNFTGILPKYSLILSNSQRMKYTLMSTLYFFLICSHLIKKQW